MNNTTENNEEIQKLIDMKIHSSIEVLPKSSFEISDNKPIIITRVPGGWVYSMFNNPKGSVFIPIPSHLNKVK